MGLVRRWFVGAFVALLVPALVAVVGCGRAPERSEGRVVIEFWHAMGGAQGRAVNELVDAFNQSQEEYYVRAVFQGNYNALSQKLIASLYARRNPAIAQMYPSWTARFYGFGYLEPMASFVAEDGAFAAELGDFFPIMLEEGTVPDPGSGVPTLATLPFNKSVYVVQANWSMMEAAGWSEPPRSRAEFVRLAEALTVRQGGAVRPSVHGFAIRAQIEDYTVQMMAANAPIVDEATGEIFVDSPESIATLHYLLRLVRGEGGDAIGYVESDFLSGVLGSQLIGMYIASTASFPFNDAAVGNRFIWRAFPVPSADESVPGRTLMQGTNVGIFRNLSREERAAAWAFTKFLCEPETNALWAMRTNYMPVRKKTLEVPKFKALMEENLSYANSVATLDSAMFEPRMMYWESVRQILNTRVQAVLRGREAPESAMRAARQEILLVQRAAQ